MRPRQSACLARQAIHGVDLAVCGYELLYHNAAALGTLRLVDAESGGGHVAAPLRAGPTVAADIGQAAATLTAALTDIGLDRIVGQQPAWVNIGDALLSDDLAAVLPPERTIVEVFGATSDPRLGLALARLREEGYRIALAENVACSLGVELAELADVVRIDVRDREPSELAERVSLLGGHGLALLAANVATHEALERYRDLGLTLFQGEFLSQPRLVSEVRVSAAATIRVQLAAQLNDPDANFDTLSRLIAADVTLSYRLLRYINSAYVGLRTPVSSLREALVLLGTRRVRSWATLLLLSDAGGGRTELVNTALLRAHMCGSLAAATGDDGDAAFLVGLLSVADALVDRPLAEVLDELPLDSSLTDALLGRAGPLGELLARVIAFERGDFLTAAAHPLDAATTTASYIEAIEWSSRVVGEMAA